MCTLRALLGLGTCTGRGARGYNGHYLKTNMVVNGGSIDIVDIDCLGNGSFTGQWCPQHGGHHLPGCDAILNVEAKRDDSKGPVQSSPQLFSLS